MYKVRKELSYRQEVVSNYGAVPSPEVCVFTPSLIVSAGMMGVVDSRLTMPQIDDTHDMNVRAVDRFDLVGTNAAYSRLCALGATLNDCGRAGSGSPEVSAPSGTEK